MSEIKLPPFIKLAYSETGSFNLHCRSVKGNQSAIFVYGIPNSVTIRELGLALEELYGEISSFKQVSLNVTNPVGYNKSVAGQFQTFFENSGYEFVFSSEDALKKIVSNPRVFIEAQPYINRMAALSSTDFNNITNRAAEYESEAQTRREEISKQRGVASKDGWIKVTAGGKHKTVSSPDGSAYKIISKEEAAKYASSKKEVVFSNFYTFQRKQQQMDKLSTLRAKFEQDKAVLEELKKSRKEYFAAE